MPGTPLVSVDFPSIYPAKGEPKVPLPKRMAMCTPDMKTALLEVSADVAAKGGKLRLSDLFRSYDMQLGSHMDYVAKRKKAFSPPPGGSMHEAGRAFDLDLGAIKMKLSDFWIIAKARGLSPVIEAPTAGASESWHFDCRGSHQLVYDYYKAGKGTNFEKPYAAMAASAILAVGVKVDKFGDNQAAAYAQSALVRLGKTIGNIDGSIGPKSRKAISELGIAATDLAQIVEQLDHALQERFPGEFFDKLPSAPFVPK